MTDDEKRVRFHEMRKQVEDMEAALKPERDKYDAAVQAFEKKIAPIKANIKAAEKPIFDLKQEIGQLARELRGPDGIIRTALPEQTVN